MFHPRFLLLLVGVFLSAAVVADELAAKPACCVKHAYCCTVNARCCDHHDTDEAALMPLAPAREEVAKPSCCTKHAYCCSIKSPCCGKELELEITP